MASSSGGRIFTGESSSAPGGDRRIPRGQVDGNLGEHIFDTELPSSLGDIARIIRVAKEFQASNPRVAYLCYFYAFEKAYRLDPASSGEGVRQFKTALLQRLEMENDPTMKGRVKKSDVREMRNFYQHFYKYNIQAVQTAAGKAGRNQTEIPYETETEIPYETEAVLFEVLKAINTSQKIEVDQAILEIHKQVNKDIKYYCPYNILPLDHDSANNAIMQYPEIQAALLALRNTAGLQWPEEHEKMPDEDLLGWLQATFGFQRDNVSNQREHLILLLANVHIRRNPKPDQQLKLDDQALDAVMKKLLKNYRKWCKYLEQRSSLWLPTTQLEVQQRKLLYVGLYLLIWGEAANLRFMPECLCYIYHHMCFEVYSLLTGYVNPTTSKNVKPAYGGKEEDFLKNVVTPIYQVIEKEAQISKSKRSSSKHSHWRNYDDLNEYFWSKDCFRLGWPMRADANFFTTRYSAPNNAFSSVQCVRKVNFVEIRSFWHIFRSFDRMWSFLILSLQAIIIISWNGGPPSDIFDGRVFKQVLSIFITAAILKLGQALMEIVFTWKARGGMSFAVKLWYIMKLLLATAWVIILPVTYIHTWENPSGVAGTIKSWLRLGEGWIQPSSYKLAVVIYLGPNMLAATLFLFPFIRGCLESSNLRVITFMMWWSQPCVFVGRGTHGGIYALFKYMMFWVLLLAAKLTMSYYLEIKPLVQLTKDIMKEPIWTLPQHELSPHAFNNVGVMLALWTPIILVYFMDTHIWYAIFSTFIGGIYGAWNRIGEIRTIGMVRSRFKYLLKSFNQQLSPSDSNKRGFSSAFSSKPCKTPEDGKEEEEIAARFAQYWNLIITSFREEDLIDNREKNFLLVPYCKDREMDTIQWPPFLLASKIPLAVDMATDSNGIDRDIKKKMKSDPYYTYAIKECYASFKNIIYTLVVGPRERELIGEIFTIVDYNITHDTLLQELNMRCFPFLYNQFVELLELLKRNSEEDKGMVIFLFQDMFEVVLRDIVESELNGLLDEQDQLFVNAIDFPVKVSQTWTEKIKRLYLLLTVKESATDVPTNPEARRRISFFANSLFMKMPSAPKVRHMMSFSVLTPHHREQVLFSSHVLEEQNEDGLSILSYLQKMYPDEWTNFLERVRCQNEELRETEQLDDEIRLWASYRGQTLTRTVRGMMYYRQTLVLQSFLDMARDDDLMKGFRTADILSDESPLLTQCKALADMKFTYVVSCRQYGIMKRCGDPCAHDILRLMATYPSLRVAYIDEVEERRKDENAITKVYYSSLVKVDSCHRGMKLDQLIYRIKLPGNEMLGEEKPENQNHAIIFTRGEGLQTIDMNQDHYMEETLKIRNMLQEFLNKHDGVRYPTILGVKEHIYTSRVRFHYGHSDIFDRLFHLTRGGVSKASKIINLSGDIFAGFNTTLRAGNVTHHEYMQVGKGVDVDLDQISLLEATIAYGNGEQTLSRDVYRLGHCFDFFRMLSCYYSTVGSYFSTMIMLWTVYVFLYGRFYLVVSGLDEALPTGKSFIQNKSLQVALASQSVVQLGFLMALPMMMEICLERGIRTASRDFVLMQVQLASVFFAFSLGTKTHYYGTTLLHGGAKRRAARNGFVVFHAKFAENYRLYSKSHFTKGIELMFLLVIYEIFGQSYRGSILCIFITFSMWFMVVTWLFAPFLFNPYGFEWHRIVDDWTDWNKWISNPGGIGIPPERSWESWWEKEQETLRYSGKRGTALEIVLALRFFTYQYGLVYHLSITKHTRSVLVYGLSWVVIVVILLVAMTVSAGRRRYREEFQHVFRLIKGLIFITSISALIILIAISHLTIQDIFVCVLAFSPTGCGLILVAQALKPVIVMIGLWSYVKALARGYDIAMGFLLFSPVVLLAWFPFVSEFQTRIIFNPAFSRGLQTSWILGRHKGDPAVRKEI